MSPARKPTEVGFKLAEIGGERRYQFIIDAANVVRTLNATLVNLDASEQWPIMLKMTNDYLFVKEEEIRHIRLLCPDCDSVLFDVPKDGFPTCFDCGWIYDPDS